MARNFSDIAFTPSVRAYQTKMGSRGTYARLDDAPDTRVSLGRPESDFIAERDGFYQASVGENGWPYVQFRGGPAGFLKVMNERTIGYADFRGNVQYISAGNIEADGRVTLILMDYAHQRRLKIWGRARLVDARLDGDSVVKRLEIPSYRARVERAVIIDIEAFDWNCPQHITPRFTESELGAASAALTTIGDGPLPLVISGVRQLTPRIRAYELRAADGRQLPRVAAGAHLDVPVHFPDGGTATRRYSIASNPQQRDMYEIAVLREDGGSGGSRAVHVTYALGMRLNCGMPGNDFALHDDPRPAVLYAGGIGITPIKAMATALQAQGRIFTLHYAARSANEMAYRESLRRKFAGQISTYFDDAGLRLDVRAVLREAAPNAVFYVCGPARMIDSVRATANELGIAADRLRFERFTAESLKVDDMPLVVELRRSGRTINVSATQTILEAAEAAGIAASFSCRNGTCSTCATKVLDGTPDHRDTALTDAEREDANLMCICVSRARTAELALDL